MDPLNPILYHALVRRFHEVHVRGAGCANTWFLEQIRQSDGTWRSRRKMAPSGAGEEYQVDCPYCNDLRGRLTVNHMWGVRDPDTGTLNLWAAQCWNEQCLSSVDRQRDLYQMLTPYMGKGHVASGQVKPGKKKDVQYGVPEPVDWPGEMWTLDTLPAGHQALTYLRSRDYDPMWLAEKHRVQYCGDSFYPLARDRLVFPLFWFGTMVGWQTRFIGDTLHGEPLKHFKIPKYWSNPGMPRDMVGYNLDRAMQYSTIIVVEGFLDCVQTGPQAVGCLGKVCTFGVQSKIIRALKKQDKPGVVVLMTDPKQDEVSKEKGRMHHIEQMRQAFEGKVDYVLPVYLPEDRDPGSSSSLWLRQFIQARADEAGVPVLFGNEAKGRSYVDVRSDQFQSAGCTPARSRFRQLGCAGG